MLSQEPTDYSAPFGAADPFADEVRTEAHAAMTRDHELDQWFDEQRALWEAERDETDFDTTDYDPQLW